MRNFEIQWLVRRFAVCFW